MTTKKPKSISESFLDKSLESKDLGDPTIDISPLEDEIELISDPAIKKFVRYLLKSAPAFWKAPASHAPDLHPPDESFPGGLVLHTKRVVRVVMLLAMTIESENQNDFDCLVAAAILHDLTKFLYDEDTQQCLFDPMHPYTVDRSVDWSRQDSLAMGGSDVDNTVDIDAESIGLILRIIRCSHGMWSPIPETVPISDLEKALHTADLVASNIHGVIDGLEVKLDRWI